MNSKEVIFYDILQKLKGESFSIEFYIRKQCFHVSLLMYCPTHRGQSLFQVIIRKTGSGFYAGNTDTPLTSMKLNATLKHDQFTFTLQKQHD